MFRFPRARRRAGALRGRGPGALLSRARSRSGSPTGSLERGGTLGRRRPRRLPADPPRAGPRRLPRAGGAHQPPAVIGRRPDRLRARRARAGRVVGRGERRRRDGGGAGRPHGGIPQRPLRGPLRRPVSSPRVGSTPPPERVRAGIRPADAAGEAPGDRLGSTTHITAVDGDGGCAVGHLLERHRLGRDRPGHRGARQQHARRGGPEPAGLPRHAAGKAGAVDDVSDARPRGRRARSRASAAAARTGSAPRCSRRSSA